MIRILFLLVSVLSLSCASLDKSVKQQEARFKLNEELSDVEIKGNPVDLTIKILDEAYEQMESDDATRVFGKFARFAVGETPGYKIVVGEKIYPKFRERFMGDGFVWRDKIVDLNVELNSSDIKVEAPIRIFGLKNRGGDTFTASVDEKEGNSGNDMVKTKARMVRALDSAQYSKAVTKVKKLYPEFDWQ